MFATASIAVARYFIKPQAGNDGRIHQGEVDPIAKLNGFPAVSRAIAILKLVPRTLFDRAEVSGRIYMLIRGTYFVKTKRESDPQGETARSFVHKPYWIDHLICQYGR